MLKREVGEESVCVCVYLSEREYLCVCERERVPREMGAAHKILSEREARDL